MSISALNRSSFSAPAASASCIQPPPTAQRAPEAQGGLRQKMMTDSFDMGTKGAGGGFDKQLEMLSQLVAGLAELMKTLQSLRSGGAQGGGEQGGGVQGVSDKAPPSNAGTPDMPKTQGTPEAPKSQGASDAPKTQGASDAPKAQGGGKAEPLHSSTNKSDAGPGFGAPSAGSNEPPPAGQPWLAKNNVGSPYNSNMLLIEDAQKDQYKYTNTFTNDTGKPQTITLWNKTGEHGGPNDGQNFDKSTPKTFTLQPGQSQTVAFDTNSSVAWCVSKDGAAKPGSNSGQTWGEATFANGTTGWSGYDTSQIAPGGHNGKMSIRNEANGHTVTEANAWQTEKDDPAGKDVGVPAGPLHLTTAFS